MNKLDPIEGKSWIIFQGMAINEYLYYNYAKYKKHSIDGYFTTRYGKT